MSRFRGGLRACASAAALCAVFLAQAASSPVAPACTASLPSATWADCAGAVAGSGPAGSPRGAASATLTFDGAIDSPFGPFDADGHGAPISSIDFSPLGASVHSDATGNGLSYASTYSTQPLPAIPEPHTNLLMLAGLAAIGFMATRRRRP